jgi:hypothetical protein
MESLITTLWIDIRLADLEEELDAAHQRLALLEEKAESILTLCAVLNKFANTQVELNDQILGFLALLMPQAEAPSVDTSPVLGDNDG